MLVIIFPIRFVVTEASRKDILLNLVVANYAGNLFELYLLFVSANFPCQ